MERSPGWALVAFMAAAPLLAQEAKLRFTLEGHTGHVMTVAFSPDGKTLASGSDDKTIKLWDMATGKNTATLSGHEGIIIGIAFSPDGKTLASGGEDNTIKLWDVATGKNNATLNNYGCWVYSVAFSPDGKTLASNSCDWTVKLWDVASGKNTTTSEEHDCLVFSLVFSPDGKTLACALGNGAIKLSNLDTGKSTAIPADERPYTNPKVVFSPDGKTLATAASCDARRGILLWDLATGKKTASLEGHGPVAALAYTVDGKALLSAGVQGGEVKVWDPASGKNTATINVGDRYAFPATFSPAGNLLALGTSGKTTIELWDLGTVKEAGK